MQKGNIGRQLFEKISQRTALTPLSEWADLETVKTLDGRDVGGIRAFSGERIEKMTVTDMSLAPGMSYINVLLKPSSRHRISRFYLNYMEMGDKIQFDVDLYPVVDLVLHIDYQDKYYELLRDAYLQAKEASWSDWKLSVHGWMRAMTSPYYFMSAADKANEEKVHALVHAYVDVWLKMWEEEAEVSPEEAGAIQHRRDTSIKYLLEREPERHMLEKVFGRELTDRIGIAIV